MLTYNHQDFIEKAILSVLEQKTNYSFRLQIFDDASTDKTKEICQKYVNSHPQLITYHAAEHNIGIIENYIRAFKCVDSEYVSILEGDDYWIDEYKIERQINVFRNNCQIGLVHSNYQLNYYGKIKSLSKKLVSYCLKYQHNVYPILISHNFVCPLTTMFRAKYLDFLDYNVLRALELKTIDYFLWLHISLHSSFFYENLVTGHYRILNTSISNNSDFTKRVEFAYTTQKIVNFYLNKVPVDDYKISFLLKENDMKLLLRAIITTDIIHVFEYLKKFSFIGLFRLLKRYFKFYF